MSKRRRYSAAYKFKVALAAARGDKTLSQLAQEYQLHPGQISTWKRQLLEEGERVFERGGGRSEREQAAREAELYEQIGRLRMELEWLKKTWHPSIEDRRAMIEPQHPHLGIRRQCELLGLGRTSYSIPQPRRVRSTSS